MGQIYPSEQVLWYGNQFRTIQGQTWTNNAISDLEYFTNVAQ